MSRRRGPGRFSACCRPKSVLQQSQCSLPGHLGVGVSPHLPRGTPGSHNLPELQPQGHKPRASSVAEGEMFQVTVSAVKKVHEPAGPGAEGGACARRRGPGAVSSCQTVPHPPQRQDRLGRVGDMQRGCCLADQRVQRGAPLFSCRTGSPG